MDDTALLKKLTESNDLESYDRHFEPLSKLQKWQRKETLIGDETEIDERTHHFALKLTASFCAKKTAVDFYCILLENNRKSYDETVKAFRQHYNVKPVVIRGRL